MTGNDGESRSSTAARRKSSSVASYGGGGENSKMAAQSQGIKQLMAAEKEAAQVVANARKEKNKRLKLAKEEAGREIEAYRQERELQFNQRKKNYDGSKDDFEQKMEQEKRQKLIGIKEDVGRSKDQVIHRLLAMVYDIKPELHRNKRVE